MTLLDEYEKYHTARTDAELNFGRILFLQELGGILGPKCYNNLSGRTNHNSYVALIGPSSRSRKTTVQDLVKDLTEDDWRHPDEMSPEQLLVELVDNPQNFWFYGEWSKILKRIDTNHYLSDIAEITNVIFTCPKRYTKKLRGKDGKGEKFEIEYPYLCFNTTCTEEVLLKHLDEEMTHGGYLARFIIVRGGSQGGKRKIVSGEDRKHYGKMKRILNHMWTLKQFHKVLIFQLTEDARDRHYQIEQEMYKIEGVEAFAGRYGGYLASFADILMVSDKLGEYIDKPDEFEKIKSVTELFNIQMIEGEPIIFVDTEYIERAWEILKPHLKYSAEVVNMAKVDKPVRRLTQTLRRLGAVDEQHKVGYSEVMRASGLNATEMKLAQDTMMRSKTLDTDKDTTAWTNNRTYEKVYLWLVSP